MTQITPETDIALSEEWLLSLIDVIRQLRRQIEDLKQEVQAGGMIDKGDARKPLTDVNDAVLLCLKVEMKLDECRNKQAGIARGGYALDMDKARAEIGCKLDQLRRCGDPGTLPE